MSKQQAAEASFVINVTNERSNGTGKSLAALQSQRDRDFNRTNAVFDDGLKAIDLKDATPGQANSGKTLQNLQFMKLTGEQKDFISLMVTQEAFGGGEAAAISLTSGREKPINPDESRGIGCYIRSSGGKTEVVAEKNFNEGIGKNAKPCGSLSFVIDITNLTGDTFTPGNPTGKIATRAFCQGTERFISVAKPVFAADSFMNLQETYPNTVKAGAAPAPEDVQMVANVAKRLEAAKKQWPKHNAAVLKGIRIASAAVAQAYRAPRSQTSQEYAVRLDAIEGLGHETRKWLADFGKTNHDNPRLVNSALAITQLSLTQSSDFTIDRNSKIEEIRSYSGLKQEDVAKIISLASRDFEDARMLEESKQGEERKESAHEKATAMHKRMSAGSPRSSVVPRAQGADSSAMRR